MRLIFKIVRFLLWDGPNGTNSTNLETEHHKMFLKTK